MDYEELARQLVTAAPDDYEQIFARYHEQVDSGLAWALKVLFDDAESSDLGRAAAASNALGLVAALVDDPQIHGLANWTDGMVLSMQGQMEAAHTHLETASERFLAAGRPDLAAATRVNNLYVLAMLGRYDAALSSGEQARAFFLEQDDLHAAGKIEQNLGNIHFRRDRYDDAEELFRSARRRYVALDDAKQLAQIDNCLGTALTAQYRFGEAVPLYEAALARAEGAGLEITRAEVECNLGCLFLYQGHYDRALDFLEQSRRRYAALGMSHESAIAEQELADAYLELNLLEEAATTYTHIIPAFAELGMRAEEARARAFYSRVLALQGRRDEAGRMLEYARMLYIGEGNAVGEATVRLAEALLHLLAGDYVAAESAAAAAEPAFVGAKAWGRRLFVSWLRGEALRAAGETESARTLLRTTLQHAEREKVPQVVHRCHTSLGLLALGAGDTVTAEAIFRKAITTIELLREPLPADEFRTAFLADKLTPYTELVRLCLASGTMERAVEAFGFVERAKSRALVDMLGNVLRPAVGDALAEDLLAQLEIQRTELNWLYRQIDRPETSEPGRAAPGVLDADAREREMRVQELTRWLRQRGGSVVQFAPVDLDELRHDLGVDTALVEYFSLDDELLAFVVTNEGVQVVRNLGSEPTVEEAIRQLSFHLGSFRNGSATMRTHIDQLTARIRHRLGTLYDLLLRPIIGGIAGRRLLIVPHRALHYVPFHALHDGDRYVIEQREVCFVPSASVLRHCLQAIRRPFDRALLVGVPDALTPGIHGEIQNLATLFPEAVMLFDSQATCAALRQEAPAADLIHLACHAQFRPDNPRFSSLRLADGVMTIQDAAQLELRAGLVTLSACETGVSMVAPGDELIGLARGFFAAGTPALIVSLWTADDSATARLMSLLYAELQAGAAPSAALRAAQIAVLSEQPHPFFWAPFVLLGRWG